MKNSVVDVASANEEKRDGQQKQNGVRPPERPETGKILLKKSFIK
jgi:hypothetical protein